MFDNIMYSKAWNSCLIKVDNRTLCVDWSKGEVRHRLSIVHLIW